MEDYKEKYEMALERARDSFNYPDFPGFIRADVVFPELKESEDERIRREIIEYLKDEMDAFPRESDDYQRWIAWLEKQRETFTKRDVDDAYVEGMAFAKDELEKQKNAWSKEDEIMIANIRDDLFCYQTKVRDEDHQLAEDIEKEINWLKSLKQRYTWKPSDSQMRALEYIINNTSNTSYSCKIAKELLEQLKKLKGKEV